MICLLFDIYKNTASCYHSISCDNVEGDSGWQKAFMIFSTQSQLVSQNHCIKCYFTKWFYQQFHWEKKNPLVWKIEQMRRFSVQCEHYHKSSCGLLCCDFISSVEFQYFDDNLNDMQTILRRCCEWEWLRCSFILKNGFSQRA